MKICVPRWIKKNRFDKSNYKAQEDRANDDFIEWEGFLIQDQETHSKVHF